MDLLHMEKNSLLIPVNIRFSVIFINTAKDKS